MLIKFIDIHRLSDILPMLIPYFDGICGLCLHLRNYIFRLWIRS